MRSLAGMEAVVIGRSNIVGKPVAQLLLAENATVTIAHSKTRDLPRSAAAPTSVVAAIGRPEMVRGDWIKPGATVIDVGINRVAGRGRQGRIVGDVAFAEAAKVAGAHHAGAGRRRPDDDRLPAAQHAARRLRADAACRALADSNAADESLSSPGTSRRSDAGKHSARLNEMAGTSPAMTA